MLGSNKVTQFLPQLVIWQVIDPNGHTITSLLLTTCHMVSCSKNFVTIFGPKFFLIVFINSQPLRVIACGATLDI